MGGGAIGLASALVLGLRGARRIDLVEPSALRQATARAAGFGDVYSSSDLLDDKTYDLVVDAVGLDATRSASMRLVRSGGAIVHLGLSAGDGGFDIQRMTLDEVIVAESICYTPNDFEEAIGLLEDARFPLGDWLQRRPMHEATDAFREIADGKTQAAKIVLVNQIQ